MSTKSRDSHDWRKDDFHPLQNDRIFKPINIGIFVGSLMPN